MGQHFNPYAGISLGFDAGATLLSLSGLLSKKFTNPAASYMALVVGAGAGVVSGCLNGGWQGVLAAGNKFFAGTGELALAYTENAQHEIRQRMRAKMTDASADQFITRKNSFFGYASNALTYPVRVLRRTINRRPQITPSCT